MRLSSLVSEPPSRERDPELRTDSGSGVTVPDDALACGPMAAKKKRNRKYKHVVRRRGGYLQEGQIIWDALGWDALIDVAGPQTGGGARVTRVGPFRPIAGHY
jgi:hypothetical protein